MPVQLEWKPQGCQLWRKLGRMVPLGSGLYETVTRTPPKHNFVCTQCGSRLQSGKPHVYVMSEDGAVKRYCVAHAPYPVDLSKDEVEISDDLASYKQLKMELI